MDKNALKELKRIRKAEEKFRKAAHGRENVDWKKAIEDRIPDKTIAALKKGFGAAFRTVFNKGTDLISRLTFDTGTKYGMASEVKDSLYTAMLKSSVFRNSINGLITTAEGVALGSLGIGIPDIVFWIGMLLKGVYEEAESFGYEHESLTERLFILRVLEVAMLSGEAFDEKNHELELDMVNTLSVIPNAADVEDQIDITAEAFATDMLVTKFIQSIPVIGIAGGLTNPIYYRRVIKYVNLQYRKRAIFDNYHK